MQPLERSRTTPPDEPALGRRSQVVDLPVQAGQGAVYQEGQSELPLLRGPVVLRAVILTALLAVFICDLSRLSEALDITALYPLVIVLSVLLWSLRWVVCVTAASMLLNLIGMRLHAQGVVAHTIAPATHLVVTHLVVLAGAQVATGVLSYQMIVTQRRYQRDQHAALRRQRDLYLRERDAREALQQAREDAERQAAALSATLQREREARQRAVQARDERERLSRLTETFQRALLPSIPDTAARGQLLLGALYAPAIQEMQMGGDFYDVIGLEGDRVGLVIGDIAGHGVEAAARTAIAGTTLRAYAAENARSPARVLERLNRTLTEQSHFTGFVSLFYGVYDPATHTLTYANAGHEPPMVLRGCALAGELGPTGMVAGVNPEAGYTDAEQKLDPGDCLVLLTDGLTEARNGPGGTLLGWDGAARMAERHCRAQRGSLAEGRRDAAKVMAKSIFEDACRFAGAEDTGEGGLQDDLALLVVCVAE